MNAHQRIKIIARIILTLGELIGIAIVIIMGVRELNGLKESHRTSRSEVCLAFKAVVEGQAVHAGYSVARADAFLAQYHLNNCKEYANGTG